jgi:formate hydrogenlyase subunit 4
LKILNLTKQYPYVVTMVLVVTSFVVIFFFGFKWLTSMWSLIGVYINIHKMKSCFVIWAFTNASWAVIDFYHGLPEQGTLFTVYFLLAIYGLWQWHKEGIHAAETTSSHSEGSN